MVASGEEFKVNLGDMVQMQYIPENDRERMSARIIGFYPGHSLIVSTPKVQGKYALIRDNQRFIIRALVGNRVCGFETEVLKAYTAPYPHLHIRQPQEIETVVIRRGRRARVNMVISVSNLSQGSSRVRSAVMVNVSVGGALIKASRELGDVDEKMSLSFGIAIGNIEKYLKIGATIRNIIPPDADPASPNFGHYQYGLQFTDLNEDASLLLHGFVYGQIVKELDE